MKKILLGAAALLSLTNSIAQTNVIKCGSDEMKAYYMRNLPGYKEQVEAAETAERNLGMVSKTMTDTTTVYTIPVVFHVLHSGEPIGTGANLPDADFARIISDMNNDYAKTSIDVTQIDPLFINKYKSIKIQFVLAKKDPLGNCTNGIIRHYDLNTFWGRGGNSIFNYKYSTNAPDSWSPNKYMNVYIVTSIAGGEPGLTTVGYTYKPGQSPTPAADAIVYTASYLSDFQEVRSLSHEAGHWLNLAHTFGNANNAGLGDCGDDGVSDTPMTDGSISTCPIVSSFPVTSPTVTVAKGNTDITMVSIDTVKVTTIKDSLRAIVAIRTGTTIVSTSTLTANGTKGEYSNLINLRQLTVKNGVRTFSISTTQTSPSANGIAVYLDLNQDGNFDLSEAIYTQTAAVVGSQTVNFNYSLTKNKYLMRVIANDGGVVTDPAMVVNDGEYEDYYLNVGFAGCDTIRPNVENIMDYSSCPKMFTEGQRDKMRTSIATNPTRMNLVSAANLSATGVDNTTPTPCAPIADFMFNSNITCAGKTLNFTNESYNGTIDTYSWIFTGGTPSTSSNSNETVNYSTPGVYPVSLTVTNAQGNSTKTFTNIVVNHNAYNSELLPTIESFDNGLQNGWNVVNKDFGSVSWQVVNFNKDTLNASNPGKCMALLNASTPGDFEGHVDILETRVFNFSTVTSVNFSFDYSAPIKPGISNKDTSLVIEYSLDCGGIWKKFVGTGTSFPMDSIMAKNTAGTLSTPYYPINSVVGKWATFSPTGPAVTLVNNALQLKSDVKFRLKYQTNQTTAQNLFIDNFRISGVVGIEELANTIGLNIYPNPTSSTSTIEFTSPVNSNVEVLVTDITGRLVEKSNFKTDAGLASKYVVNKNSNLTAGMYVVSLILDGQKVTKKLIIN